MRWKSSVVIYLKFTNHFQTTCTPQKVKATAMFSFSSCFQGYRQKFKLSPEPWHCRFTQVCTILVLMVENKIAPVVLCIFFTSYRHEYLTLNQFVGELLIKYLLKGCISMLNDINYCENEILSYSKGSCHCPVSRGLVEVHLHSAPGQHREQSAKALMNIFSYRCKSPFIALCPKITGESRGGKKTKQRNSAAFFFFFLNAQHRNYQVLIAFNCMLGNNHRIGKNSVKRHLPLEIIEVKTAAASSQLSEGKRERLDILMDIHGPHSC